MRKIEIPGGLLSVADCGAGPTLLLIHGFPLNHAMWSAQLDGLATNHRILAPDLRGFGGSSVRDGTMRMEDFADDLAALLDALELQQPVCLCGLSMGGYVAFAFWRKYASRVRSLVLCDTRSGADAPEVAAGRRKMADDVPRSGAAPVADMMLPKLLDPHTAQRQPRVAEAVRQMILATDPRGIAAAQRGMAARPDVGELLPSIRVRTLVLVGAADAITPEAEMRQMAGLIPGAQFAVIADAGHLPPTENPAEFNRLLEEFLHDELHAR